MHYRWQPLHLSLLLAALVFGSVAVGCGEDEETAKTLKIAWVPKALNNPVFETGRDGALMRASELSSTAQKVELIYAGPVASDAAEQAQVIDGLVADGIDGLAVSCNDVELCGAALARAAAKGVKVMTWDSDANAESGRITYFGTDNAEGGMMAAKLLAKLLSESGEVAVLSGVPGAANLDQRIAGFTTELAKYPGLNVVATVYCDDDTDKAVQVIEQTMAEHPELDGWFIVGLWPLAADVDSMPLWKAASLNGSLKSVAFDTLDFELELMEQGLVHGLIGQKYWAWGYESVSMLYEALVNGKTYGDFTNSGMDVVCPNNVAEMQAKWASGDFSTPLTPCDLLD
ncbi:MAG: sugar-binding protein [Myxococcota bacterium]|jgi:ribose transport system substrate-binding protein|nr:sugar-binding protein [Myxococcota bacterium]